MKRYKVTLRGENFVMKTENGPAKCGFYTSRYVEADDPSSAEEIAARNIKGDEELKKSVLNEKDNSPLIFVEQIVEIDSFDDVDAQNTGYAFYPMEGKEQ